MFDMLLKFTQDNLVALIVAGITAIINIIGFVVASRQIKKSFRNEVKKLHKEKALEQLTELPLLLLEDVDEIMEAANDNVRMQKVVKKLRGHINIALSYGSGKLVDLAALLHENMFYRKDNNKTMVIIALLVAQARIDVSDEAVSPENWFKIKIKDYETSEGKSELIKKSNKIVRDLKLNKKLLIKENGRVKSKPSERLG